VDADLDTLATQGHVKITSCIGLIAVGDRLWDEFGAGRPCSE